jgi:hypothetical protein
MWLRGSCHVYPPAPSAAGYVVVDAVKPLASMVGRPRTDALAEALRAVPASAELLVQESDVAYALARLPGWTAERAILHTLGAYTQVTHTASGLSVRLRPAAEVAADVSLGAALRAELRTLDPVDPVAFGAVGPTAASFCYAGAITERFWDVSVETLEAYRGRGFAGACARRLIDHYSKEGRAPV